MTEQERRTFSSIYERRIMIFERKYRKVFHSILQKQFDDIAKVLMNKGMSSAKHATSHMIFDPRLTSALTSLHKEVGLYFAQRTDQQIHQEIRTPIQKTGRIGFNPRWVRDILSYFSNRLLDTVTNINRTTLNRIEQVLTQATNEGWGIDQTVRELRSPELTQARAELIARTESAKAANRGREAAVSTVGFQMNKEWIATLDLRTRPAHMAVNGTIVDEDEMFIVGGEEMTGPGDPDADAENVCNCRCTMAFIPKRNAAGRLIPKSIN